VANVIRPTPSSARQPSKPDYKNISRAINRPLTTDISIP
jgi:hypothetical protein